MSINRQDEKVSNGSTIEVSGTRGRIGTEVFVVLFSAARQSSFMPYSPDSPTNSKYMLQNTGF